MNLWGKNLPRLAVIILTKIEEYLGCGIMIGEMYDSSVPIWGFPKVCFMLSVKFGFGCLYNDQNAEMFSL